MRNYFVCLTCGVRIAGCSITGCAGVSYCILCKNVTCFRFQYPKCFINTGDSQQLCPECREKEDKHATKRYEVRKRR